MTFPSLYREVRRLLSSDRHLQAISLASCLALTGCHPGGRLPDASSKTYSDFVSAFYVGLAALQVGDDVRAESTLADATKLVPGEPAGWANWGILALRQRNFDAAAQRFAQALSLDKDDDRLYYLEGLLESDRGNSAQAIADLRDAVKRNPRNLRALYLLASEVERQSDEHSDVEFEQMIQQILSAEPNNLAALVDLARIAAKRGDAAGLHNAIAKIEAQSSAWPAEVKQQLDALKAAANGSETAPITSMAGSSLRIEDSTWRTDAESSTIRTLTFSIAMATP